MSDISRRLRASLKFDAIHGTIDERTVCENQMREAAGTIDALREENEKMRKAIEIRLKSGHNDTCGFSLSKEYPCSCGHDNLAGAGKK